MARSPRPNQIIHGDALSVMRRWPDACIDHCIADPPFNMSKKKGLGWAFSSHVTMQEEWDRFSDDDFFRFNVEWLREVCRVVKPNGSIIVFGTYHNIYQLGFILQNGLNRRILNSIVWYKPNAQPNITARMLTESTEHLIWAVNGTPTGKDKATGWVFNYWKAKELAADKQHRNRFPSGISGLPTITISNPVVKAKERINGKHPSQKPVQLVETLLALFTRPADLVLDPFAGSGSLAQAAIRRGRQFLLIEQQNKYYEMAKKNVADEKRNPKGTIYRWAELKSQPLTEVEIAVLDRTPVPQADDLSLVIRVIDIVESGTTSRTAIAKQLISDRTLESGDRQWAYYADAAQALGWIYSSTDANSEFAITERGQQVLSANATRRRRLIWEGIKGKTHFGFVADDMGIDLQTGIPDESLFCQKLIGWFELSPETASRRTQTILHWIQQLNAHDIH